MMSSKPASWRSTEHPPGLKGVLSALALLSLGATLAAIIGVAIFWLLQLVTPPLPSYVMLIFTGLVLIPILSLAQGRFPFLRYWFYFLPALLFLLVFTIYPLLLTLTLAFTDFAGNRSGQANRATQTEIVAVTGATLQLTEDVGEALRCAPSCVGRRVEVQGENERTKLKITDVQGDLVTVAGDVTFEPAVVSIVNDFSFIGFRNFAFIFSQASRALGPVFIWNLVFAFSSVILVTLFGLTLAVLLNNRALKLRGFYRTALIISWALPGVISIQMWQALLNYQFGAVNRLLGVLGIYPIPWLLDPLWAKVAILMVNLWLGFPFIMVATLGILATIPDELYEAAKMDGATSLEAFSNITLPLLREPLLPVLLTSFAFNFNNFNVIFLLTNGGPAQADRTATAQATDILISWAYKTAFSSEGQSAYGLGAAISLIIFFITVAISLVNFRFTGAFKEAQ